LPRFLADESCDFAVVMELRAAGHDVVAVAETARGATDEQVIALALGERRVLLTEDKDFGQLVFASAKAAGGVVFIRFPANQRTALPRRILDVVQRESARLERCFVVVQPKRTRIITLPTQEHR
jgi:predicted nuclease of predicted toxin-antitoxin system